MDFDNKRWTSFDRDRIFMRNREISFGELFCQTHPAKEKGRHIDPPSLPFGSHEPSLSHASRYLDAISGLQQRIL
jgi:hypothetical protein